MKSRISQLLTILFMAFTCVNAQKVGRPVHTFSIVARDSVTGEMGVAVQSHWFSVGAVVTWAEAGVGAIATQSFAEISYGPLGIELMRSGKTAEQALTALLAVDINPNVRQVAMVDKFGNVAVHSGDDCIAEAGHIKGDQFSVQANIMENATVWGAMAKAFESASGDLADRLVAALEAAQNEGGDIRGMQSAALLVVPGTTNGAPWKEKSVDLRVDDHPEPVKELKRLLGIHRAYAKMDMGDQYLAGGNVNAALDAYQLAYKLYPENEEIIYWFAVTLASEGHVQEALPLFKTVFQKNSKWMELTLRLPASGLLPNDPNLLQEIMNVNK